MPYKPTGVTHVDLVAQRLIRKRDVYSGQRYATRLAAIVGKLDRAFGKSQIRQRTPKMVRISNTKTAIAVIRQAHPDWTTRQIGAVLGLNQATISRYSRKE